MNKTGMSATVRDLGDGALGDRSIQESEHPEGFDYLAGSPHLKHPNLYRWMCDTINESVAATAEKIGRCPHVLEVGAGHGFFTEVIAGAGATVTVTEMSRPSAKLIERRFRHNSRIDVRHDEDGSEALRVEADGVVFVSVLHHIPDYLATVSRSVGNIRPGGFFVSFQDPLWYPRRSMGSRWAEKAFYSAWRFTQGDLGRAARTASRRVRGVLDESNPADMSEYHVVREGVDESAIHALLGASFADVRQIRYWSSQAGWAERIGRRVMGPNTFGFVAHGRSGPDPTSDRP